jgi:two-component system CheB/CheR fusion protein
MAVNKCPIVAIGASAGGLVALKAFFHHLPDDTGAAFVVIQHLDPKHESLTAEILARCTAMPSVQVRNGMHIEPNRLYVIPPNAYLTLNDDSFRLDEPVLHHGLRMPIDTFLWSLAEHHEEHAIAIIVSGTGSDGTLGIRAIKGSGGLVMAQSPTSAEYDGMPRSAINTNLVDIICAVEEMPQHLNAYLQNPYIKASDTRDQKITVPESENVHVNAILSLLQTRIGHDFRVYKSGTMARRIVRRMGLQHFNTLPDYLEFLRQHEDEVTLLFNDLLIGVTAFFRDKEAFVALEKHVITPLVHSKQVDAPIRVWIPGCSTGEEAYSIAMILIEQLEIAQKHCPIQVFASDIDDNALSMARGGLYPENIAANVSAARLQRFFSREGHQYRVSKSLRETVTFATHNLIGDPPFSNLDLITCRNLLIYLTPAVQSKVLALFHFALQPKACLFLGHSETASQQESLFQPIARKWRIYRRLGEGRTANLEFPSGPRPNLKRPDIDPTSSRQTRLSDVTQQYLLQEYAPAAVLVDQKHQVLHFSGPTMHYLTQPSGAPTADLLVLVKKEFRAKMRIALRQITTNEKPMVLDDVPLNRAGSKVSVRISLRPIKLARQADPLILITFEDQPAEVHEQQSIASEVNESESSLLQQMEDELHITREDLQSNIEELESANEELQAANEEVMSVNEELQSSNEELESSKEELQSMNEELTTVNSQYKDKVDELASTNDDLNNLLSSTNIATLFVDTQLRIGRFTPATERLFSLILTDVGRPLNDIRPKFKDASLLQDVQKVLKEESPLEGEVCTDDGDVYLRHILPYRTSDNKVAGVVLTFIDITERKQAEEDEKRLAAVVRDSFDAIALLTLDGKFTAWNFGAQKMYGWTEQQALTKNIRDLAPAAAQETALSLIRGICKGEIAQNIETQRLTKDGHIVTVSLTATPLLDPEGKVFALATTERNISTTKLAEKKLRTSEANFRALVESAPDALIIVDGQGRIETANIQAQRLFGYDQQDLLGVKVEELIPERFRDAHKSHRDGFIIAPKVRAMASGRELFALTSDKREIPIEVSLSPIETEHGPVVCAAIRDISQRKSYEKALHKAKLTADSALAAKSRFLATASHDLRQPLHSLTLLNKTLLKTVEGPQAQKMLRMQGESLLSMTRLLNSLLDISKLDSGVVAVKKSDFALRQIFRVIAAKFTAEAEEKNLQFNIEVNKETVHSDHDLLSQLLQNLVANAIRYTHQGSVTVSCVQQQAYVNIKVRDSGIGIPPEQLPHIFDEFHQVNRDPQQSNKGLGLGLSIVQRLAALLGTQVEVESEVNKGSTFSFQLPCGKKKPAPANRNQDKQPETPLPATQNELKKILLIDDDPAVLDATQMLLSLLPGINIVTAASSAQAYAALAEGTPDLIVSDFHLNQQESGLDIIINARARSGKTIPALIISGDTGPAMDEIKLVKLQRINKPVDTDELIDKINGLLIDEN